MAMWSSKLGTKYPKELIDRLDEEHHRTLQQLRREAQNSHCFECGEGDTAYASVNIGVFLCTRCADVHRALGTHISKVKGCQGTFLWGPDEVARMQQMGNAVAESMYGDMKAPKSATKEERLALCQKKYWKVVAVPTPPASPAGGTVPGPLAGRSPPTSPAGTFPGGRSALLPPSIAPEPETSPGMLLGRKTAPPSGSKDGKDLVDFDTFFKESIGAMELPAKAGKAKAAQLGGALPNFVPTPFRKTGKAGMGLLETPSGVMPVSKPAHLSAKPDANDSVWDDFGNW